MKLRVKFQSMRSFYFLLLAIATLGACATRFHVPQDYRQKVQSDPSHRSSQTTVFFLIDGLSNPVLQNELRSHRIPHIRNHFLSFGKQSSKAHSVFPSLTFPNVTSLLREKPVNQTQAIGNLIIENGKLLDFEVPWDRAGFGSVINGENIFKRLQRKGFRTVSLDYGLGGDATVAAEIVDFKAGLAATFEDFLYLDQKRIDSLAILLKENAVSQWPEFIFIHLVGLDFTSHTHGRDSLQASRYLQALDRSLQPVFEILEKNHSESHPVVSMLSADHGFPPAATGYLKIEEIVFQMDSNLKVLNEGRVAAVYANAEPTKDQQSHWAFKILSEPGIEMVSYRQGHRVVLQFNRSEIEFEYQPLLQCPNGSMGIRMKKRGSRPVCPQTLVDETTQQQFPFLVRNLAFYFQALKHPDLLIVPKQMVSFKTTVGYHGGPTADETVVPLLMRNVKLGEPSRIPALWELLQFL